MIEGAFEFKPTSRLCFPLLRLKSLLHFTSIFAALVACVHKSTNSQSSENIGLIRKCAMRPRGRVLTKGASDRGRIQLSWSRGICSLVFEGAM